MRRVRWNRKLLILKLQVVQLLLNLVARKAKSDAELDFLRLARCGDMDLQADDRAGGNFRGDAMFEPHRPYAWDVAGYELGISRVVANRQVAEVRVMYDARIAGLNLNRLPARYYAERPLAAGRTCSPRNLRQEHRRPPGPQ